MTIETRMYTLEQMLSAEVGGKKLPEGKHKSLLIIWMPKKQWWKIYSIKYACQPLISNISHILEVVFTRAQWVAKGSKEASVYVTLAAKCVTLVPSDQKLNDILLFATKHFCSNVWPQNIQKWECSAQLIDTWFALMYSNQFHAFLPALAAYNLLVLKISSH